MRRSDVNDDGEWAAEIFKAIRGAQASREAWHFPVHDGTYFIGLFTITANDDVASKLGDEHYAEMELILPALCVQAHETWRRHTKTPSPEEQAPAMKDNEVKVLSWLSLGKSTEDIAEIMALSERTGNYHVPRSKTN
ncbi:MAG: LuxR C-terminal-related transcriptional regulator [Proteobacteria bacterium]|nr:LuxR C-terminal-related transcriptional regulator [Pseudomonadota bacterium]